MKNPSVISLLTTLLLATALSINGKGQVVDSFGDPIYVGKKYFIQPVNSKGGGLVPAAVTLLPFCPLGITQTILPYQPGLPVSFTYTYVALHNHTRPYTNIQTSTTLNIEFQSDLWPFCNDFINPKLWVVANSAAKEPAILIGGKKESPKSAFTIEGSGAGERTYNLITPDGFVGATPGVWLSAPQLLVTKDESKALIVKFKKVDDVTMAATSTSRVEKLGLKMFPFY